MALDIKGSNCRERKHQLNRVSLEVSRLFDDPCSDIEQFAGVIRFDSAISSAIIELVNRSYSGFTGEITCINRAIRLLGIGQLHSIVNYLCVSGPQQAYFETSTGKAESDLCEDSTEFKFAG